jgi:hypothetical protein
VNDLVTHIDGWTVFLERPLDDLDRTHDTRAKAARLGQIHFHGTPVTQVAPNSFPHLLQPGYLQYPHHPCLRVHPVPKRMEAEGFVSKNGRLGKPGFEHGRPNAGEVKMVL